MKNALVIIWDGGVTDETPAGIAHNMGFQGYKMVLEGKIKKSEVAKRSEEYQEAIKDALNGFIDTRKDRDR